jgi:hypothetical protein
MLSMPPIGQFEKRLPARRTRNLGLKRPFFGSIVGLILVAMFYWHRSRKLPNQT